MEPAVFQHPDPMLAADRKDDPPSAVHVDAGGIVEACRQRVGLVRTASTQAIERVGQVDSRDDDRAQRDQNQYDDYGRQQGHDFTVEHG